MPAIPFVIIVLMYVASATERPKLTLTFSTSMRVSQGYGHDGDGCDVAEANMQYNRTAVSQVWFDDSGQRLAQSNPSLARGAHSNLTCIGLYKMHPPTEVDLLADVSAPGGFQCHTEALPKSYCNNGSRICPPAFGTFGDLFSPFTSILGDYYLNTSLLAHSTEADVWQWEWTQPTLMPNGTYINVTRNFTYTVSNTPTADGTRPLLRFQWTQSIPLQPAVPIHRDCFIFDYTDQYKAGPIDPSRWQVPKGVKCSPGPARSAPWGTGRLTATGGLEP